MDLHLNEQEQQLLKNVLHALYHTFRKEPGMNYGTCKCTNIYFDDLKMMIGIHDRIVDYELRQNNPEDDGDPVLNEALDYVREHLKADGVAEIRAQVDRSYRYHMNPSDCVTKDTEVIDLLEEYGEENDLPEGWWMEQGDIDDILMKL